MLPVDELHEAEMGSYVWKALQKLETIVSIEGKFGKLGGI